MDDLQETVGAEGMIAVPTFTRYDEPYDSATSPSTTGAITEALRQRENAVRSDHPTKSVAAIGPDADALVARHEPSNSLSTNSPLHRLIQRNGKILLVGVDHTANSAVHVAERIAGVPHRDQMARSETHADTEIETVKVNRVRCSRGSEAVRPLMEHAGIVSRSRIDAAEVGLLDGDALLSLVAELLKEDLGAFLCSVPDCDRCQYARERIAATRQRP